MEASCGTVHLFREIINADLGKGSVLPIIDNIWFSGVCTIFIIVNTQSGILRLIINQVVIADTTETDSVLNEVAQVIRRNLGNNTGPESKERYTGYHIQFRSTSLLLKYLTTGQTLIYGR